MERGAMGKRGGGEWEGGNGEGGKGKEVGRGRGRRRGIQVMQLKNLCLMMKY